MYCTNCGAKLEDDSRFCDQCGAAVAVPVSAAPAYSAPENGEGAFARTATMTEAAQIAMTRNPDQEWSHWDLPTYFTYSAKKFLRYCEKEDKRLQGEPVSYVVSPDGALARIYVGDNGENVLEWGFYTRGCPPEALPKTLAELT